MTATGLPILDSSKRWLKLFTRLMNGRQISDMPGEMTAPGALKEFIMSTLGGLGKMGEVSDLLDGVDNGLRYLLDCKAEWNQILNGF